MPLTRPSDTITLSAVVAANVRAEMARRGVTAARLAELIDATPYYLSRRIGRHHRPGISMSVEDIERIAYALGITPESLLQRDALAPEQPGPPLQRTG